MTSLWEKTKVLLLSLLFAALMLGLCIGIFQLNADVFVALIWYLVIASVVFYKKAAPMLMLPIFGVLFVLWSLINNAALQLFEAAIRTNPYGDYFFSHFDLRLKLSIFVLKFASAFWLTDFRLLLTALMLAAHALFFSTLKIRLYNRLPQQRFEFTVCLIESALARGSEYLQRSTILALISAPLWGVAALLLQFDNAPLLLFIMAIASFIPRFGFYAGVALGLFFVESGLFLFQLGGILIAAATIWFIHHALTQATGVRIVTPFFLLLIIAAASFSLFSFAGLFAALPMITISHGLADALHTCLPLRFPRNSAASV